MKKFRAIKDHTPGKVRYLTYYLEFPDGDTWCDQIKFVHPLSFELQRTRWYKHEPGIYRDLMAKGEGSFKDQNGVRHIIKVEEIERPRKWGSKHGGGAHKFMA